MNQDIKKLLEIQNLWIDSWEINEDEVLVKVRSPRQSCRCPKCQKSTKKVHQYHERKIAHSIWQNRKVFLCLTKRRFYCSFCQSAFSESIPDIDRRRNTSNFRNILIKNLATGNFNQIKTASGASYSVLYRVLESHRKEVEKIEWDKQGKDIVLGVDEHSFRGRRLVLTITNITRRKLLKVCGDDRTSTLKQFLRNADKQRIAEVCIDMNTGYLNAIRKELPKANVTVDKFHVVAYANKALDEVRSVVVKKRHARMLLLKGREKLNENEKARLNHLFKEYQAFPSLYEAYFVKEKLREMYRLKNKNQARMKFSEIVMFCETSNSRFVKALGRTLWRWRPYILNYFNCYSTNAFTEGVHTKIKMIKRISFGFRNINHYIAKVALAFAPLLYIIHHTV